MGAVGGLEQHHSSHLIKPNQEVLLNQTLIRRKSLAHYYVDILDRYFGSVRELDLIFNFHKAYYILNEILIAGKLQESSKRTVGRLIAAQDSLVEIAKEQANSLSNIIAQASK
uniref:AP complex mu/sigma subunit domain-containing protein n=1 Tax=Kalanchoe fedtschenkoi TaxID=63787 RepID=A0A7N0VI51_KALFE